MSKRSQVMDKYWLEFIADTKDGLRWPAIDLQKNLAYGQFWSWFFNKKVERGAHSLDDYMAKERNFP